MLDRYLFGVASRISPEAPVPVVHIHETEDRAGGAANVAVNLASLGVQTSLLGVVGDDDNGDVLERIVEQRGIACHLLRAAGQPTITKSRVQSHGHQLIRLDREVPLVTASDAILSALRAALDTVDLVVLSDYGKGSLQAVDRMIGACRDAGIPVLVDPKGHDFDRYRGATLLTPNQAEFEVVAGRAEDEEDLIRRAAGMAESLDLGALLITRSEKGLLLAEKGAEPLLLSTHVREVFDVTGAGDTVIAMTAAALASGCGLADGAKLANLAAGLVVRKIGVASVTRSEMQVALHHGGQGSSGIVSETELLQIVAEARGRNERIVMTNGCFDILHAGHVGYLEEARELGDRLIVAVNDDDSVRRLKGASRPVNKLADRMSVLAALASVDWVVPFAEDTPERVISAVRPHVLVKGGDYRPAGIAGSEQVVSAGGEVRVLPFRDGLSSTGIISRSSD